MWYKTLHGGLLDAVDPNPEGLIINHKTEQSSFKHFFSIDQYLSYLYASASLRRCFDEVIFDGPQKLYFDLDIKGMTVTLQDAIGYCLEITRGILKAFKCIKPRDIIVLSSHGNRDGQVGRADDGYKFSYHIIVDRHIVMSSYTCRHACESIIRGTSKACQAHVDTGMYKSIQMLRMFGSTKHGEDRFFVVDRLSTWMPVDESKINLTFGSPQWREIFIASLVSKTFGCTVLAYNPPAPRRLVSMSLNPEIVETALEMVRDRPYRFREVTDTGLICLQRLAPEECKACPCTVDGTYQIHEAENPYLCIMEGMVRLYCRRSHLYETLGQFHQSRPEAMPQTHGSGLSGIRLISNLMQPKTTI